MRHFYLILTILFPIALAVAQNAPQKDLSQTIRRPEGIPAATDAAESPIQIGGAPEVTNAFGIAIQTIRTLEAAAGATNALETAETRETTNQVDSSKGSFLMNAGVQYADEGEYKEAEQAYLRALKNDPESPNIRFRLATIYIQMSRYGEAEKIMKKMVEQYPNNAAVRNNLAWTYATGGEVKNGKLALHHAREAILIEPSEPSMWNTLAEAYYVSGQYDKALRASGLALDIIKQPERGASGKEISEYEKQHAKIQRSEAASKRLLGLDTEE